MVQEDNKEIGCQLVEKNASTVTNEVVTPEQLTESPNEPWKQHGYSKNIK